MLLNCLYRIVERTNGVLYIALENCNQWGMKENACNEVRSNILFRDGVGEV